jgi:hypothetical protein
MQGLTLEQTEALVDVALTSQSLTELDAHLSAAEISKSATSAS